MFATQVPLEQWVGPSWNSVPTELASDMTFMELGVLATRASLAHFRRGLAQYVRKQISTLHCKSEGCTHMFAIQVALALFR